ncbi:MAG: PilN domain-containing protein [Cyanobacteria bacterium Co-bin13]|nr:PilN domain-containing protein [Cyanobacteria bacterium Co-bin13]
MYGLDINFLNDRKELPTVQQPRRARAGGPVDRRPLVLGLIFAVGALGLVGGYWLVLRNQVSQLQAQNAQLDQELASLQSRLQAATVIQGQIEAVRAENQAFAAVFNQILPWSALLQDIRDRTPTRVQLTNISQTAGTTPEGQPEAQPPRAGGIEVQGVACSFNDINDFALVLQRSPLLQSNTVRLSRAEKQSELLDPQVQGTCPGTPAGQPEFLVDYTIQANLTDVPASQLIEELERQGTVGLVARLRALRETGVIE